MIRLVDLTKDYVIDGVRQRVADNLNVVFPTGQSVALIGRNGAGKSSLLRMIAGNMRPTSGRVEITGTVSWPVGFAGSFHPEMSGYQNACFVARIYGLDSEDLIRFVQDFAGVDRHFHLPVRTYSTGMRARLAFAMSMAIDFDTYLIDEVTSVGDLEFRRRCEEILHDRMKNAGAIVVAHNAQTLKKLCTSAVVLEEGQARVFDDLDEALRLHKRNMFT